MRIVGVIAEYNPFHQGHAWHLSRARRLADADYVIVAMSGSYVQRGAPAMFDKYTRAEAALLNGADLVLELPPCIATGSAEYFASGAVRLLADTGIVTDLCFGTECGDQDRLLQLSAVLSEEPEEYRTCLKEALRRGWSWPAARAWALRQYDPALPSELLDTPNNLLGIEYLKALRCLNRPLRVHTVQRTGASYHEFRLPPEETASASGIRQALKESQGIFTSDIRMQLPSCRIYQEYDGRIPVTEDAFSLLLLERLMQDPQETFESYFGVTEEISNRIRSCLYSFTSFSRFTQLIKTRNLTQTSVSRALLHILLRIREYEPANVLRVLGLRQDARILLTKLSQHGSLPLVTSPADDILPESWRYADRLYESVCALLHERPLRDECRRKLLVF